MLNLRVCRATERDFKIVVGLINTAAKWLRTKDTKQWRRPWPTRKARNARVRKGLQLRTTWLAWTRDPDLGRDVAVATITLDNTANPIVWNKDEAAEPAAYVNRLVVDRKYAGRGVGADLLNWAASEAASRFGAEWIRIDVWTDNEALHKYYERQGFERVYPDCPDEGYPSRARFRRPIGYVGDGGGNELKTDSGIAPLPPPPPPQQTLSPPELMPAVALGGPDTVSEFDATLSHLRAEASSGSTPCLFS
jgi:GNAT superfamily N-acetyltransferase